MWEGVLGGVIVAALGGLGWLIKRFVERRSPGARIEEAKSIASLHRDMQESGATLETIAALRDNLLDRRRTEQKHVTEILNNIETEFNTQNQMNAHSGYLLEIAESKLKLVIFQYQSSLDSERSDLFDKAQRAWQRFVEAQARFSASLAAGGTMYPLIYASEKEELTVQRAAALRASLEGERES